MDQRCKVDFPGTDFKSIFIEEKSDLSRVLDVNNSPLLFGCRTGICGTCLVEVTAEEQGAYLPPSEDEKEVLALLADENPKARLACQLRVTGGVSIKRLEES